MLLERLVPYEARWSMTRQSFLSDLKYLVANGATLGVFSTLLGLFAITTAGQENGLASDWPFAVQLAAILLIFEAAQYSLHRFEHEGRGAVGRFMWRVHAAHHLPEKVYIVMHVAGHPINAMLVQGVIMIVPIWLMGYSEMVVVTFLMLNSMHGLISHFNVDARIGIANYVFIGTAQLYQSTIYCSELSSISLALRPLDWVCSLQTITPCMVSLSRYCAYRFGRVNNGTRVQHSGRQPGVLGRRLATNWHFNCSLMIHPYKSGWSMNLTNRR